FSSDTWLCLKAMIFIVGFILFIISLTTLILGIKKDVGLVQNGIYKYIRHPQNLSIIIMAFPLFMFLGFRMGDFVSWVQFIFLMIIYSDIGDIKLKKKYPADFQTYYEKSGFFLPRVIPYRIGHYFSAISKKRIRYPLLLLIYILCIFTLYQIFLFLPFFPSYF
ncbi:MAG: isoprenylcysteine carboxylmethyltransferase family protein, partial [Candidatus Lokiarchaeota archaeon]